MSRKIWWVTAALICPAAWAQSPVVYIKQEVPYFDTKAIDRAVVNDCRLPPQAAELIESAALRAGIKVVRDDAAVASGKGRILRVEIMNALSEGVAYTGHRKEIHLKGRLTEDGKEIGDFFAKRFSMGGVFGPFSRSCTVLVRVLDMLADDIAVWLKNPAKESRIGD